ncbi:hypothetical protein ACQP1U_17885 [Actinomycetota bacterium]
MSASTVLALAALVVVVAAVVCLEGATVLRCVRALTPAGPATLTRQGAWFLASEVWVVGLLGLGHALVPTLFEHPSAGAALAVYVVGWVLRDIGLWFGPRSAGDGAAASARLARTAVSVGAAVQLCAAAAFAIGIVMSGTWQPPTAGPLLAAVAVLGVAITAAGQSAWRVLRLGAPDGWFAWPG